MSKLKNSFFFNIIMLACSLYVAYIAMDLMFLSEKTKEIIPIYSKVLIFTFVIYSSILVLMDSISKILYSISGFCIRSARKRIKSKIEKLNVISERIWLRFYYIENSNNDNIKLNDREREIYHGLLCSEDVNEVMKACYDLQDGLFCNCFMQNKLDLQDIRDILCYSECLESICKYFAKERNIDFEGDFSLLKRYEIKE